MSTQSITLPNRESLCSGIDDKLSCMGSEYITYSRYHVGKKPDIDLAVRMVRMRRIVCDNVCGLSDDDISSLMEYANKMILS